MVQIDVPMAFGLGALFAGAAREKIQAGDKKAYYRALARSLVFQIVFVFWLPLYLLVTQFGFQTTHMWWKGDSLLDYPALLPGFFLVYFLAHLGGFRFGVALARRGQGHRAIWAYVAAWAVFIGWVALQPNRSLHLGSYQEYKAGVAPWIWQQPSVLVVIGLALVVFNIVLVWFYRDLRRN
jgi:hypothetical protein